MADRDPCGVVPPRARPPRGDGHVASRHRPAGPPAHAGLALLAVARHRAVGRTPGRPPTFGARRSSPSGRTRRTSTTSSIGSPVTRRWSTAAEHWHVRLRLIDGHGSWRGVDVLDGLVPGTDRGRIAVVTRADVRPTRVAGVPRRRTDRQRRAAAGTRTARRRRRRRDAGRSAGHVQPVGGPASRCAAFATSANHLDVVRRTREERWYGEELFARFEPYASSGSWDGRDPLAP